jgi:hypothetical protein
VSNHFPITPPLALINQWWEEAKQNAKYDEPIGPLVAIRAAQWGADQELEACCEWIESELRGQLRPAQRIADDLRAARRPKPPSLKEQALAAANLLFSDSETGTCAAARNTIRRALESLDDQLP